MDIMWMDELVMGNPTQLNAMRELAFTRAASLDKLNCPNAFNLGQLTQVLDQKGIKYIVVGTAVAFEQALTVRKNDALRYICSGEWQEPTAEDYNTFYNKFLKI